MNIAVVGSRTFNDYKKMKEVLSSYTDKNTTIVSGGARGADRLAEKYAEEKNLPTKIFIPDWDGLGKKAGFIRNEIIVENSDMVIAFWDGQSRGTKHTIELAKKMNKKVVVFIYANDNPIL